MTNNNNLHAFILFSYLEMLSVERTAAFLSMLGIEIDKESYPDVMRYSRSCLEASIYIAMHQGLADSPNLQSSWERYRATGGVLNNLELEMRMQDLKGRAIHEELQLVYEMQKYMVEKTVCDTLDVWFHKYYIHARNGVSGIDLQIYELVHPESRLKMEPKDIPLSERERESVIQFCNSFYDKQSKIRRHFTDLHRKAVLEEPSVWEAVLQTLPADSKAGCNYPWLYSVRDCCIFRLFLDELNILNINLGASVMNHFMEWVKFEAERKLGETDLPVDLIKHFLL
jgi:hypothetical protein